MSSNEANDIYTFYDHIFCGILWYFYNVASFTHQIGLRRYWLPCLLRKKTTNESQRVGTYSKCHKTIFCSQFLRTASVNSQEAVDIIVTQGPPFVAKGMILCTWAILIMLPKIRNSFHSTVLTNIICLQPVSNIYVYIAIIHLV